MRKAGSAHIFGAMEPVVGDEQLFGPTRAGSALDRVQAYQLAQGLAGPAFEDATLLQQSPLLSHLAPQLMRAAGSIAANIAEGYVRRSPRDRVRYFEYALGSTEETRSWYTFAHPALSEDVLTDRIARLTSIRRLLLVMIRNDRPASPPRR
jgi:four helix bundle protein